jgi:intracellular septation protein
VLNLIVVFVLHASDNAWVNFKLFGCTGLMLVFVVGQSIWLTRHIKHPEQE